MYRIIHLIISITLFTAVTAVEAGLKSRVSNTGGVNMGIAVDLNRDGKIDLEKDKTASNKVSDETKPELPFRFWINNDLDVVNYYGEIRYDLTSCDGINVYNNDEYQQRCEQWDEDPERTGERVTNTSYGKLERIESFRDLEDFSPMLIKIDKSKDREKYYWQLKAVGVGINLFKSNWNVSRRQKAHSYIYDSDGDTSIKGTTQEQILTANNKGHFVTLRAGTEYRLSQNDIDTFFGDDGKGAFIFEGIRPCAGDPASCYVELSFRSKENNKPDSDEVVSKVYLDLHDIKDFYQHVTAGTAQNKGDTYYTEDAEGDRVVRAYYAFHAKYQGMIETKSPKKLNIYDGLFPASEVNKDLVVFVHGWRMLDAEKISFAETSFKRLYWSGYKSQFATFSWPTGWFEKPAYLYSGISVLGYVLGNERNYDRSEEVARRVGADFREWLINTPLPNVHIIAHSMGNVVVSEALNYNGSGNLVASYTASQAATAAGSYDSNANDMVHQLQVPSFLACPFSGGSTKNPEEAWRCYNIDNELEIDDTPYDMPPDLYRYNFVESDGQSGFIVKHGPTTVGNMGPNPKGEHHFKGISQHVGRILNFYNKRDAALTAWEFNQLTKPDFADGKKWFYTNSYRKAYADYETCLFFKGDEPDPEAACADKKPATNDADGNPVQVISEFKEDGVVVPYNEENKFRILAYSIPARTEPLGQASTSGEIQINPEMTGFSNSNQDHSAPFHGYYSERSLKNNKQQRAAYWNTVLDASLDLPDTGYTGLKK